MNIDAIKQRATELGPWITRLRVLGEELGGTYDATNDDRVSRVVEFFPQAPRVLELGCLEGGHTTILRRAYPYSELTAIDGRPGNIEKAKFLTSLHGCDRIKFGVEDLEVADLTPYGKFDLCVCLGLLYHLADPAAFLKRLAGHCDALWIWTTICDDDKADASSGPYRGRTYREGSLDHPLSALREVSFFPTLGSLIKMLRDAGFADFHAMNFETTPNGPSVMLACRKQPFRL